MILKKYTIPIITLLAIIAFFYLFTNVVVYLIISLVLALLGSPIVKLISNIQIGRFRISASISAVITLVFFFVVKF